MLLGSRRLGENCDSTMYLQCGLSKEKHSSRSEQSGVNSSFPERSSKWAPQVEQELGPRWGGVGEKTFWRKGITEKAPIWDRALRKELGGLGGRRERRDLLTEPSQLQQGNREPRGGPRPGEWHGQLHARRGSGWWWGSLSQRAKGE